MKAPNPITAPLREPLRLCGSLSQPVRNQSVIGTRTGKGLVVTGNKGNFGQADPARFCYDKRHGATDFDPTH